VVGRPFAGIYIPGLLEDSGASVRQKALRLDQPIPQHRSQFTGRPIEFSTSRPNEWFKLFAGLEQVCDSVEITV
jgi:hypothetical protein